MWKGGSSSGNQHHFPPKTQPRLSLTVIIRAVVANFVGEDTLRQGQQPVISTTNLEEPHSTGVKSSAAIPSLSAIARPLPDEAAKDPAKSQNNDKRTKLGALTALKRMDRALAQSTWWHLLNGGDPNDGRSYKPAIRLPNNCKLCQKTPNKVWNGYVQTTPYPYPEDPILQVGQLGHRLAVVAWHAEESRRRLLEGDDWEASHLHAIADLYKQWPRCLLHQLLLWCAAAIAAANLPSFEVVRAYTSEPTNGSAVQFSTAIAAMIALGYQLAADLQKAA
ncbi:hypothetical protein NM208_g6279 [Fusarium decemcellulare]|uniref:Uncharacterized protein n=1 Tax=Fusarium decemcellulare TaxID=57161 RepID=A0ACC1SDM4_9HYPO|nr:hypothetical protein NM208_g6279 [Fusarium decemcellulare]